MRRIAFILLMTLWPLAMPAKAEDDLLITSITGARTTSGLEDPQYVLSFPSVQRLVLSAAKGPVSEKAVKAALSGTPVEIEHLLKLQILEKKGRQYHLAYLVLTRSDQELIHATAEKYGTSLALAFESRRQEFEELFQLYDGPGTQHALAFVLISGFSLNWSGLNLTSDLGYRVIPKEWPNGDEYIFFSREAGARLNSRGHYLGSHSAPSQPGVFTTFGDGPSQPRISGVPDVYFGAADEGMAMLSDAPEILASVRGHFLVYLLDSLSDASKLLLAARDGVKSRAALSDESSLTAEKFDANLNLLLSVGYLKEYSDGYRADIVVLDKKDREMTARVVLLSRDIMSVWLEENYDFIKAELSALNALQVGQGYEMVFSEIWHDLIGFSTAKLVETGFTLDPYKNDRIHIGYEPVIWSVELSDSIDSPF